MSVVREGSPLAAAAVALLVVLVAVGSLALADLRLGWDRALLGLLLAWPVALALERPGPAHPLPGLLAGGLVGGLIARWALSSATGVELPKLLHLVRRADGAAPVLVLAALAAAGAAPLLLVRREPAGTGAQLLGGAAGGALLLAALLPGGTGRLFPCAAALVAGSGVGLAAGLLTSGETRRRPPLLLAGQAVGCLLVGLLGGVAARAALTPSGNAGEAGTRAALLAIHAAQEAHRARTGGWARQPGELTAVDSAVLSGCAHGHLFRFANGKTGWAVAADTLAPPLGVHLAIDERGVIEERPEPIRLAPR